MAKRITAEQLRQARAALKDIDRRHGEYMDEMLAAFGEKLDKIIERAVAEITSDLTDKMDVGEDGTIEGTIANLRSLQGLDRMYTAAMNDAGYQKLLRTWVGEFPGQLPLMQETLAILAKTMKLPINPAKLLTPSAQDSLVTVQQQTIKGLRQVVANVGTIARKKALSQVNGLKVQEFSKLIETTFDRTTGQADALASTGMAVFYRTATERALRGVEKETPLKYSYDGPNDAITRPFCRALKLQMADGKTWTREEIAAMDNGQIPDVFLTCGGFRCRHQWRVALPEDL